MLQRLIRGLALAATTALLACGEGSVAGTATDEDTFDTTEVCDNQFDDDRDGKVDENCPCDRGEQESQSCYAGAAATEAVGPCKAGSQECVGGRWGPCVNAVEPTLDICDDGIDNDCNGTEDDGPGCGKGDSSADRADDPGDDDRDDDQDDPADAPPPKPQCDASNCDDGCCDDQGTCHRPPDLDHCGLGASSCDTCDAASEICKDGASCQPRPPDHYSVILVSARVDDDDCGWTDTCDPYAKVELGTHQSESDSEEDDESPTWNHFCFKVTRAEILGSPLKVELWDEDSFLRFGDDKLDTCQITVSEADLSAGRLVSACGDSKDLTFKLSAVTD
jgi:hypothetical protein